MIGERVSVREGIDGLHFEPGAGAPLAWEAKSRSSSVRHWWPWQLRGVPSEVYRSRPRGYRAVHFLPWALLGVASWAVPGFFSLLVVLLTLVALALMVFVLLVHFPLRWLSGQLERPVMARESTNGSTPPSSA